MTNKMNLLNAIVNTIESEEYEDIEDHAYELDRYAEVAEEIIYNYINATKYSAPGIIEDIKRAFRNGADEVELVIGSTTLDINICLEFDIIEE